MNQNKKMAALYIFLLVFIGIASIWILHHHNQTRQLQTKIISIDGFADHATFTKYNAQGKIEIMMSTTKATHLEPSGQTLFEKPKIILYSQDQNPWTIHADQGISNKNGDHIILQNNVVIHRMPSTQITTQQITLLPKVSRAITNQSITLTRPGISIHGIGFTADFKTGTYQIHSQSKAIYTPWEINHVN